MAGWWKDKTAIIVYIRKGCKMRGYNATVLIAYVRKG